MTQEIDSKDKQALEAESLQVINFTNIDSEDFEGMWGGVKEIIEEGETVPLPRFKALHFTKHLVNKILIREGIPWTSKNEREPLEKECLGEVEVEPDTEEDKKKVEKKTKKEEKEESKKEESESTEEGFEEKPDDKKEEKEEDNKDESKKKVEKKSTKKKK